MEKRPIQITMRGILLATFWMAVCFGILAYRTRHRIDGDFLDFVATYLVFGGPFIAGGALIGRTEKGLLVALGVVLLWWFVIGPILIQGR